VVGYVEGAVLALHGNNHKPGGRVIVVELGVPRARGPGLDGFFLQHLLHTRQRLVDEAAPDACGGGRLGNTSRWPPVVIASKCTSPIRGVASPVTVRWSQVWGNSG
jgi:hypothetical protein